MTASSEVRTDCARAQARRNQVLDAAMRCFRDHGFHAASMSRIASQAGMSTGHIYHYFENKEAIITSIVERELESLVDRWAELRASQDVGETMVEHAAIGVLQTMEPDAASLRLEIVAESVRNPAIARVVQAADRCCMSSLIETLRIARESMGRKDDEDTLAAMAEVIASMFEGLTIRIFRNPNVDRERMATMIQRVMRQIIDRPDWLAT